jgi:hypothetical protein
LENFKDVRFDKCPVSINGNNDLYNFKTKSGYDLNIAIVVLCWIAAALQIVGIIKRVI